MPKTMSCLPSGLMSTTVLQHSSDVAELVGNAENNTRRYQSLFCEAADDLMRDVTLFPPASMAVVPKDVFDVMLDQVRLAGLPEPSSYGL